MKKNKIIGVGIALLGTVFSIGAAFALYQKTATPSSFSFGAFTYTAQTGDITYKINGVVTTFADDGTVDQSASQGIDPDHDAVWVKIPLSASYPSTAGVVGQSTIGGNVSVTVTLSDAWAAQGVTMTTAAYMGGYSGTTYYNGNLFGSDQTLSSSSKTASGNKNIGVSTVAAANQPTLANNQYLVVYMSFDIDDEDMLALGGSQGYSINVNWGARTDTVPYVVGDANNFTEVDEYQMVPVIDENIDFEKWCFQGLTGFNTMKVKEGENWIGAAANGDDYGNVQIASASTYNVYYKTGAGNLQVDGLYIKNV